MITRQEVQFNPQAPGVQQVQSAQVASAQVNLNKFLTAPVGDKTAGDRAVMSPFLDTLAQGAQKLGSQDLTQTLEDAYLRGAAKYSSTEAQIALDSNPLTKDWEIAGYRDTVGKLKLADSEAKINVDMKKLREQPPEKMEEYLAKRRAELLPTVQGLTRDAQKAAFNQLLTTDRAAIKLHQQEYTKHIIDTQNTAWRAGYSVGVDMLDDMAKKGGDDGAYNSQTTAVFSKVASMYQNPNFPKEVRQKLVGEAMEMALNRNHMKLYEMFKGTAIDVNDGVTGKRSSTMLAELPFDEQIKLNNSYKSSRKEMDWAVNGSIHEQRSLLEAQIRAGTYKGTYQELTNTIKTWQASGALSAGQRDGILDLWNNAGQKNTSMFEAASAVMRGDDAALGRLGKTPSEGVTALVESMQKKGIGYPEQVRTLLQAGAKYPEAYKKASDLISPAIEEVRAGGQAMSPERLAIVRGIVGNITQLQNQGDQQASMRLLSGLSAENRAFVSNMLAHAKTAGGSDPDVAIAKAQGDMMKLEAMSPADRAALEKGATKQHLEVLADINNNGKWRWLVDNVTSMWSPEARTRLSLRTDVGTFEDKRRAQEIKGEVNAVVLEELQVQQSLNPLMVDHEQRASEALAAAQARSIPTPSGPMFLPRGANKRALFGVAADTNPEQIGHALEEIANPASGNRVVYRFTPNAKSGAGVYIEEKDAEGRTVHTGVIDTRDIQQRIDMIEKRKAQGFAKLYGAGSAVKSNATPGLAVNFNGENSQGIDPIWMHDARAATAKYEQVRDAAYPDPSGKGKTVGVGIFQGTPEYNSLRFDADGKVSKEQIDRSFAESTNRHWGSIPTVMTKLGVANSQPMFNVLAQVAYQTGPEWAGTKSYQGFLQAVQARKPAGTVLAEFHKSAAYRAAHKERRQYMDDNLRRAITW